MRRFITLSLLSASWPLLAAFTAHDAYYQRHGEGWFWKISPKVIAPTPQVEPRDEAPKPEPIEDQPLTSAWFRKHLPVIRDEALDDPTPEHVHRYFQLQRALIDKAQRFSDQARNVVMEDPGLDEHPGLQGSHSSVEKVSTIDGEERERALFTLAKSAGMLFVYRSDCRYCHWMAPLISAIAKSYGFHLMGISLDGPMLEGLNTEKSWVDPEVAHRLGIQGTPALFLMVPPNRIMPVMEGSGTQEEVLQRLISIGHTPSLVGHPDRMPGGDASERATLP